MSFRSLVFILTFIGFAVFISCQDSKLLKKQNSISHQNIMNENDTNGLSGNNNDELLQHGSLQKVKLQNIITGDNEKHHPLSIEDHLKTFSPEEKLKWLQQAHNQIRNCYPINKKSPNYQSLCILFDPDIEENTHRYSLTFWLTKTLVLMKDIIEDNNIQMNQETALNWLNQVIDFESDEVKLLALEIINQQQFTINEFQFINLTQHTFYSRNLDIFKETIRLVETSKLQSTLAATDFYPKSLSYLQTDDLDSAASLLMILLQKKNPEDEPIIPLSEQLKIISLTIKKGFISSTAQQTHGYAELIDYKKILEQETE